MAFDIGQIIQNAALLSSAKRQAATDALREKYLNTQIAGAEQQQSQSAADFQHQQALSDAKNQYYWSGAVLRADDPKQALANVAPKWVSTYDQAHGAGAYDALTPDQVRAQMQWLQQRAESLIGPQQQPNWVSNGTELLPLDKTGRPIQGVAPIPLSASPNAKLAADTARRGQDLAALRLENGPNSKNQLITRPAGNGLVQDYVVDLNNPGQLKPVGQPYDASAQKGGTTLGSREGVMFQRVAQAGNSAAAALQNISELPVGASSGFFGVGASPGHSLLASAKGVLTNKLSSQDVQSYNTMLAGVSRNLSTLETAGLSPNGSITGSMDAIQLREGDTNITKLRKLAEMRQIIEKNLEPNLANPRLPPEQKDLVRSIVAKVQQSIPFTQHDITVLQRSQQKNPEFTLQDLIKERGLRPAGVSQPAPEGAVTQAGQGASATAPAASPVQIKTDADYAKLPSGTEFIAPDGSRRRKP